MLELKNVSQKYKYGALAIDNFSMRIKQGEVLCILGKSEAGKTSLLKTIAGINQISSGEMFFGEKNAKDLTIEERNVFLTQEKYGFFNNKTVRYNLEYPLKIRKYTQEEINSIINNVTDKFNLNDILDVKVRKITKEDRIKVTFARAFLRKASVYMFDNVFKISDDRKGTFDRYKPFINELKENGIVIWATDSVYECKELDATTCVLNYGIHLTTGRIEDIENNPVSLQLYKFFDNNYQFEDAMVKAKDEKHCELTILDKKYFILKENLLSNLYYDSEVKVAYKVDDSGISLDSIKLFDSRSEYCIYFGKIFDNLI